MVKTGENIIKNMIIARVTQTPGQSHWPRCVCCLMQSSEQPMRQWLLLCLFYMWGNSWMDMSNYFLRGTAFQRPYCWQLYSSSNPVIWWLNFLDLYPPSLRCHLHFWALYWHFTPYPPQLILTLNVCDSPSALPSLQCCYLDVSLGVCPHPEWIPSHLGLRSCPVSVSSSSLSSPK